MRKALMGTLVTMVVLGAAFMVERSYRLNRDVPKVSAGKVLPAGLKLKNVATQEEVPLSKFKGKVVLVNFWASWCAACMAEMPSIQKLYEAFKNDGFEVVGVNVDDNPAKIVPAMVAKLGLSFQNFIDVDGGLSDAYDVVAIPFSVIANRKQEVVWAESGERDWASPKVMEEIKRLLDDKS